MGEGENLRLEQALVSVYRRERGVEVSSCSAFICLWKTLNETTWFPARGMWRTLGVQAACWLGCFSFMVWFFNLHSALTLIYPIYEGWWLGGTFISLYWPQGSTQYLAHNRSSIKVCWINKWMLTSFNLSQVLGRKRPNLKFAFFFFLLVAFLRINNPSLYIYIFWEIITAVS